MLQTTECKMKPLTIRCSCGQVAKLISEAKLKKNGSCDKFFYYCNHNHEPHFVGCHPGTTEPLGTLANASLRKIRKNTHLSFDPIWQSGDMSRKDAYSLLALRLNVEPEKCHIGMFDEEICFRTQIICQKYYWNKQGFKPCTSMAISFVNAVKKTVNIFSKCIFQFQKEVKNSHKTQKYLQHKKTESIKFNSQSQATRKHH